MLLIKTRVGPSSIHGTGVFADQDVLAETVIWRFNPPIDQILSSKEVADLPEVARSFLDVYAYPSSDLGGQLVLPGDHARFLNHSDAPNTHEQPFISLARRDIALGEEITCDYGAFCEGWLGLAAEILTAPETAAAPRATVPPHRHLYTRLQVSTHGVGVFAIRDIPEGLALFTSENDAVVRVSEAEVRSIPHPEIRRMYLDFCPTRYGDHIAPVDFNLLGIAWYMNHSGKPNVAANQDMRFFTRRRIALGEELTIDYTTFSDHAPGLVADWIR